MNVKNHSVFEAETYETLSPEDLIAALFAEAEQGPITVPAALRCDFLFEPAPQDPRALSLRLRGQAGDRLTREERELTEAIRALAGLRDPDAAATPDLLAVWNHFLKGVQPGCAPEEELSAALREGGDEALRKKEEELWALHRAQWEPEARRRLGDGPFAYALLMRARRLYELFRLNAPDFVWKAEEKRFAQALVFHRCALL